MHENCIVFKTMDVVERKWGLLVLLELSKAGGSVSFAELRRRIPQVTPKIITIRLRELGSAELLSHHGREYTLSQSGRELLEVVAALKQWALRWRYGGEICKFTACSQCSL